MYYFNSVNNNIKVTTYGPRYDCYLLCFVNPFVNDDQHRMVINK